MDHTTQRRTWVSLAALLALACALLLVLAPLAARADDSTYTWSGDESALTVSDDGTITISGDGTLTVTSDTTASVVVSAGTVSIVVADEATLTSSSGHTVYINSGATVTLSGGTYKCTANDTKNAGCGVVYNFGTCTIESGTYYNASSVQKAWYTVRNEGTMTINGGTFTGDAGVSGSSLITNDQSSTYYATLTINDGTFGSSSDVYGESGNNIAIKNNELGTVTINGGTFYGTNQSVQNWGTATINGGTFNSKVCGWGWDTYESTTTIYDGTFADQIQAIYSYSGYTAEVEVVIYGGTYEESVVIYDYSASTFSYANVDDASGSITIYHGDFSEDVSGFVAEVDELTVTDEDGNETTVEVADVISVTTDEGTEVHALVYVEAVDATCTEDGNVAYYYCAYCGELFVAVSTTAGDAYAAATEDDVTVAATGHSWDEGTVTTEATCTEAGVTTYTCTACGETVTEAIAATGHAADDPVIENLVAATEAADGSYDVVVYCSVCETELYRQSYTYASSGHDELYAAVENVVEATETEDGSYDVVVYCAVCGEEVSRETVTVEATGVECVVVYRLYNPYSGEHLYTTDENEYETLVGLGWTGEGVAWLAPASGSAVYRLYNPYTGDHHYTTDLNEYATLAGLGWEQEGVAFYSADEGDAGVLAVYRLYNPYAESFYHLFTTDSNEYSVLAGLGWEQEGLAFYGLDPEYYGLGE